ncbi:MAG: GNAT family N-acetyltransferase [Fusobacteriaceae bacterium]|jgi:GNAT superfamily N-acetyltransferase|nr:GNAT family N-acetyltransferase [Fusobacteriaceae bacterium]MBU9919442.1 GNAT family N-acetyltransferase [Fusobacteriaceae bacterium]
MINIRNANINDSATILGFIKELAEYENMSNDVVATEELLKQNIFEKKLAEVIIAEFDNKPVGFALFFHNFSTFLGKGGIYLEDLYVQPAMRGKNIGKTLLSSLAKLAVERDCGRLEWSCLNWNEPSIKFYKSQGAIPMNEWTVYRVTGNELNELASKL